MLSDPSSAPLLFFDSGIGGLSVLRAARPLLPLAPIVYAADYAGLPYGTRSEADIAARVPALLGKLAERFAPSLIVIACNTASTIALAPVRAALDLPIVGTVPAIKPAAERTRTGVIGLLGTEATIRQPYVDRLHAEHGAGTVLLRHASAELVQAAEARMRGEVPDAAIFRRAMEGLLGQPQGERIDQLVLACTHFPLVAADLAAAVARPPAFVDGAAGIARRIVALSAERTWPVQPPAMHFVTSGGLDDPRLPMAMLRSEGFGGFSSLAAPVR